MQTEFSDVFAGVLRVTLNVLFLCNDTLLLSDRVAIFVRMFVSPDKDPSRLTL